MKKQLAAEILTGCISVCTSYVVGLLGGVLFDLVRTAEIGIPEHLWSQIATGLSFRIANVLSLNLSVLSGCAALFFSWFILKRFHTNPFQPKVIGISLIVAYLISNLRIQFDHLSTGIGIDFEGHWFPGLYGVFGGIGALLGLYYPTKRRDARLEMLLHVPVALDLEKLRRVLKDVGANVQVQESEDGQLISLSGSAEVLHLIEPLLDDRLVLPEGTILSVKDSRSNAWVPVSAEAKPRPDKSL